MSDQRLIGQLETQFPWLNQDDVQVSGADVVQSLIDWHFNLKQECIEPPEGEREYATDDDFIGVARGLHEVEGEVEIEDPGCISLSDDGGAYVMAFVFVPGDNFCRTCRKPFDEGGDGYDGECPSCADKTANKEEHAGTDTDSKS